MNRISRRVVLIVVLVIAAAAVSAGFAIAAASGDEDKPLTGATLDRATAAALEHTGGGTVTETEVGDDGAAYSVEVRKGDGSQVEVNLDESFEVIGQEADDDGPGDEEEQDEDE
jgi:Peptidase propeptide and YPEB domain